jgi:MFS family permease
LNRKPDPIDQQTRVNIARYFTSDIGYRIGQQLSFLTLVWLTYSLGQSSIALGVLGFCYNIPFLFLSPIAGLICDLRSRKKVLMIGYGAQVVIAAGLMVAEATGTLTMPLIFAGALVVGTFATLTMPSSFAILKDFIKDEKLFGRLAGLAVANAKIGQIIASSAFGILYGMIAAIGTLFLSGLMALVSLVAVSGITILSEERPQPEPGQTITGFIVDGSRYIFAHRALVLLVVLTAVPITARGMIFYQMPAIVHRHFDSGHLTMGMLYTAGVAGGLLGGLLLQRRKHTRDIIRWSIAAAGMTSASLLALAFTQHVLVAVFAVAILDMAFIFSMGIGNVALQIITDDHRRGRVLGFMEMCIYGLMALFSLVAGLLSHLLGLRVFIVGSAIAVGVVTVAYIISIPGQRKDLDRLYAAQNVKPEDRPL